MQTPDGPTYLDREAGTRIHYVYNPAADGARTFVFVNSSGASSAIWEKTIAPDLRKTGYGTLTLDFRGQGLTVIGADSRLDPDEIVDDVEAVIRHLGLSRLILVGLSIGGLHAARLWQAGLDVDGLALINTLRRKGPLTDWISELEKRLISIGGSQLVMDCFRPVTVSAKRLAEIRPTHLPVAGYTPMPENDVRRRMSEGVARVENWDFPWHPIDVPVLIMTGMHDRLFRVQADVDAIVATLPRVTVRNFDDEGHALHTENPDQTVQELHLFAQSVDDR
jgi:pimeloyl-ACP methyl ester carboxylesterase